MTQSRADILRPIGLKPRLLNQGQAAAYVGVSPKTFCRAVAAGKYPTAKDGKWDRHAIDRVLDELSELTQDATEADRWFGERGA